jgi:hypothetical protein
MPVRRTSTGYGMTQVVKGGLARPVIGAYGEQARYIYGEQVLDDIEFCRPQNAVIER